MIRNDLDLNDIKDIFILNEHKIKYKNRLLNYQNYLTKLEMKSCSKVGLVVPAEYLPNSPMQVYI